MAGRPLRTVCESYCLSVAALRGFPRLLSDFLNIPQ